MAIAQIRQLRVERDWFEGRQDHEGLRRSQTTDGLIDRVARRLAAIEDGANVKRQREWPGSCPVNLMVIIFHAVGMPQPSSSSLDLHQG
jgi:hypothetical protein